MSSSAHGTPRITQAAADIQPVILCSIHADAFCCLLANRQHQGLHPVSAVAKHCPPLCDAWPPVGKFNKYKAWFMKQSTGEHARMNKTISPAGPSLQQGLC